MKTVPRQYTCMKISTISITYIIGEFGYVCGSIFATDHKITALHKQVHDTLFELVIDPKTSKVKLRMQKYTVGNAPQGFYHRISTRPEVDLLTLRKKGMRNNLRSHLFPLCRDSDHLFLVAEACMAQMQNEYNVLTNNCQHFTTSFLGNILPSVDTTRLQGASFTRISMKRDSTPEAVSQTRVEV